MQNLTFLEENQDSGVIQKFKSKLKTCAYLEIPLSFIGTSVSTSSNEKYHDLIKEEIRFASNFFKIINTIVKIDKRIRNKIITV